MQRRKERLAVQDGFGVRAAPLALICAVPVMT